MKIVDLLKRESVELNGKVTSKPEAIEKMVALMAAGGNLADVEAYKKGVFAREEESTTGIGEGIAIPHGKCDAVTCQDSGSKSTGTCSYGRKRRGRL